MVWPEVVLGEWYLKGLVTRRQRGESHVQCQLGLLIQMRARSCIIYWVLLNSVAVILSMFWVYCVTIMICLLGIRAKGYESCICLFICEGVSNLNFCGKLYGMGGYNLV